MCASIGVLDVSTTSHREHKSSAVIPTSTPGHYCLRPALNSSNIRFNVLFNANYQGIYAMPNYSLGYFSPKELGEAIRSERKALGRTQLWVAKQCKIRPATVSALENGKNVEFFTVMQVLSTLGKGLKIVDRHIDLSRLQGFFDEEE
jgi:DNA-binding XRE family transcriptional regulator